MSKSYKQPSIVSGKSINDIMNMDIDTFNSLNLSDMKKVVGRLVSAGNKRLRSFEKAGESSPATRHIYESGGKFSTKNKNLNDLRAEFSRAKNFLQSKTSTRKGWKKVKKETADTLKKYGVNVSPEKLDTVLKTYERLKEQDPSITAKSLKYRVLSDISEMSENYDIDETILLMNNRLDEIYENTIGEIENEISDFFEI